jgi:hypothetical protein
LHFYIDLVCFPIKLIDTVPFFLSEMNHSPRGLSSSLLLCRTVVVMWMGIFQQQFRIHAWNNVRCNHVFRPSKISQRLPSIDTSRAPFSNPTLRRWSTNDEHPALDAGLVPLPSTPFDDGMRPYQITTPIYYVNDKPHIGHAYTSTGT